MPSETPVTPSILDALDGVRHFVTETTGQAPTDAEIADALKRYFVLNEIKEHIEMVREAEELAGG